jgi:hypothetical protein
MDIKQIIYNQMNNFNPSYVKVYNIGRTNNLVYCACYYVVTSIKQKLVLKGHLFSCPVIEKVIRIELLLRSHLSYKVTFSLSQRWPLNTGLTVFTLYLNSKKEVFDMQEVISWTEIEIKNSRINVSRKKTGLF